MKKKNIYLIIAALILLLSLAIILVFKLNILSITDIKNLRHDIFRFVKVFRHDSEKFINAHKTWAPLLYIGIFSIRTFLLVIPYSGMIVLGGKLFGPVLGFIYSMVAIYLSSSIAFGVGRFLDKKIVEKIIKKGFKNLDTKVEKYGFKIILLMRLSMLFHFDLLSFAAGVTKMKYREFILATMIGIIPETILLSYLGKNLSNPLSPKFIISVTLVLIVVLVPLFISKFIKKSQKDNL